MYFPPAAFAVTAPEDTIVLDDDDTAVICQRLACLNAELRSRLGALSARLVLGAS